MKYIIPFLILSGVLITGCTSSPQKKDDLVARDLADWRISGKGEMATPEEEMIRIKENKPTSKNRLGYETQIFKRSDEDK